jgi:AraC-like DNA-binding protein
MEATADIHFGEGVGRFRSLRPPRLPLRVLRESWPPVSPVCEGCPSEAPPVRAESPELWLRALAAFDELRNHRERDLLLRRAVELLRDSIGLERAAIFLLNNGRLYGTWGTGASGETTDERGIAFDAGTHHREAFAHAKSGTAQWSRFSEVPLFAETPQGTRVLRTGENVILPIPGRQQSLGLVACDWALSGRHADIDALLRAAVLTRVLSPLLQLLDYESKTDETAPSNDTDTAGEHDAELAARAAQALYTNPNEERRVLAKRLGTTADRLGRAFKATLGEPLADYRNRLRLGRFLSLVEPRGGNLLAAALDAGFGSYAQFHRVFRRQFGCSPIEYLKRR